MKRRSLLLRLLCIVSLLVMAKPVVPHHHHTGGIICLKADLATDDQCPQGEERACHHCCNDTGCPSAHNAPQAPAQASTVPAPQSLTLSPLPGALTCLPSCPATGGDTRRFPPYIERLHPLPGIQGESLRAPPVLG